MARIVVIPHRPATAVVAEVVTLSEIDGIYMVTCKNQGSTECPTNIEQGDTWSSLEPALAEAVAHVEGHERQLCVVCGGSMTVTHGHSPRDGEFEQLSTCGTCGAVEVVQ